MENVDLEYLFGRIYALFEFVFRRECKQAWESLHAQLLF